MCAKHRPCRMRSHMAGGRCDSRGLPAKRKNLAHGTEGTNVIKRFLEGMKVPERRRVFYAILGGKGLGLAILFLIIAGVPAYFGHKAYADAAPPVPPAYVNPLNTMWVLVTAFLVFFMQAGFMFLEAGFARTRETVNVLLEGIVDTCLCGLLFWAFGFAFMFGAGNGFIGHQFFFPHGAPETYGSSGISIL